MEPLFHRDQITRHKTVTSEGFFASHPLVLLPSSLKYSSNFWQGLVNDTWQEALLFETALPG